jgi:predicted dehydrogenase
MANVCRWGILGSANIARKNWKAMQVAENATLVAVASREAAKAQAFIDECQAEAPFPTAPEAVAGYDAILQRRDIDAVYIPLPTGIRKEWVVKAAKAGKHVLCEKPCGGTAAELKEMIDACAANKVQFMDGVMFMHSARLPRIREILDNLNTVGAVRRITSQFSFAAPSEFRQTNIRVNPALEPLGALGDLGWYNIRFALWTMKNELPKSVTGRTIAEQDGVPIEFSGELVFADGITSSFYCSFQTELQQWGHISGNAGSISLSDFVIPFYGAESTFEVQRPVFFQQGCTFHFRNHSWREGVVEYSEAMPDAQEVNMIRTFSNLAKSGRPDPAWGRWAMNTQMVLDACLKSARRGGAAVVPG